MNISLTKEFKKYINQKVKSGMYHSASEVIRAALRTFQEQEMEKHRHLLTLKKDLEKGLTDIRHGRMVNFDPEKLKKKFRQRYNSEKSKAA